MAERSEDCTAADWITEGEPPETPIEDANAFMMADLMARKAGKVPARDDNQSGEPN